MKLLENFDYYKNKARDLMEESIILNIRPLDKVETGKLEAFFNLTKSEKFLEVLSLIKDILPKDFLNKLNCREKIYDSSELPFDPEKFSFEGLKSYGGAVRVYLLKSLENRLPSYALKIFRDSYIKKFFENSDEAAKLFKEEVEEIKKWYSDDLHDIFLPEYIIKLKSPSSKKESLAILQPYQTGEIIDVFEEIKKEDLIKLLKENLDFQKTFLNFITKTVKHVEKTEEILDFLGNKNLSIIINQEKKPKLIVLDPHHIFKTSDKQNHCGERCAKRIDYLKSVAQELLK